MINKLGAIALSIAMAATVSFACGGKGKADKASAQGSTVCDMDKGHSAKGASTMTSADKKDGCCPGDKSTGDMQRADVKVGAVVVANVVKNEPENLVVDDVVSGQLVTVVADVTPYTDHEGKRYYFTCNGCKASFSKNPAKYTVKEIKSAS